MKLFKNVRLACTDRHENRQMTHRLELGVGLASLKQIGRKTWEEFMFESFMAEIFSFYGSAYTTELSGVWLRHEGKAVYMLWRSRVLVGFVASYDHHGHLKRFLRSTANSHQTITIRCAFWHGWQAYRSKVHQTLNQDCRFEKPMRGRSRIMIIIL